MKFQRHFALSHVAAMSLPSKHRRSRFAQGQKPIAFAAEGLRLALFVERYWKILAEPKDLANFKRTIRGFTWEWSIKPLK